MSKNKTKTKTFLVETGDKDGEDHSLDIQNEKIKQGEDYKLQRPYQDIVGRPQDKVGRPNLDHFRPGINHGQWPMPGPSRPIQRPSGPVPIPSDSCKSPWVSYKTGCYLWDKTHRGMSRGQAEQFCTNKRGYLATIDSPEEFHLIQALSVRQGFDWWVGAKRDTRLYAYDEQSTIKIARDNKFKWSNGHTVDTKFWGRGEPTGDGDCVHFFTKIGHTLNDVSCSATQYANIPFTPICEKGKFLPNLRPTGQCGARCKSGRCPYGQYCRL